MPSLTKTRLIAFYALTAIVITGLFVSVYRGGNALASISHTKALGDGNQRTGLANGGTLPGDCAKVAGGYDCTDERTKLKVYEAAKSGLKWYTQEEIKKTVKGSVSMYSRKDSCHNPKDGACLTAAGRDTKEGVTIACPRSVKLGTKVQINGHVYTCEDRYAEWVQAKHGDTFDIFTENQPEAIKFGRQTLTVAFVK